MIVTYYAIFTYDSDGICVSFPDVPAANTCGFSDPEAIEMAQDVLNIALHGTEVSELPNPTPSNCISLHKRQKLYPISVGFDIQHGKLIHKKVKTYPSRNKSLKRFFLKFLR